MVELILTFIVMAIAFIILFWLKKTLFIFGFFFKLFTLAMIIFIAGSVLFGYLIIKDANDFRNNFLNNTNMFVVKNSVGATESFLAGATLSPKAEGFGSMDSEKLSTVEKLYNEGNLEILNSEYYKIFVIDIKSFDEVELYDISDQNVELTREEIKSVMLSDDAREELADIIAEKRGETADEVMEDLASTNEEIKSYLLSYYLTTVFNPENIVEFLEQLKNENIQVYKETALFKAVKLVPSSLIGILVKY
jgi:hypothetical protein